MKKTEINPIDMLNNPLISQDFKVIVNRVKDKKSYKYDFTDKLFINNQLIFEREQITKIYKKSDNRKLIGNLKPAAKELYLYLIYTIPYSQDWITINKSNYMKEFNVSYNTYKQAIINLCENLILCPAIKYKDTFFINPRLFFSGSRINYYPDNVIVHKSKD
mgnify:CR=1 FL=1